MILSFSPPKQRRQVITIDDARNCECGSPFEIAQHTRLRNGQLLGVTATCKNVECYRHTNPFVGYDKADMKRILSDERYMNTLRK